MPSQKEHKEDFNFRSIILLDHTVHSPRFPVTFEANSSRDYNLQDFPESGMRAALGGGAGPLRDGAHHARRADGGRALQAAGARGLRRVLWVSGAVVANTPKYLIQNFHIPFS